MLPNHPCPGAFALTVIDVCVHALMVEYSTAVADQRQYIAQLEEENRRLKGLVADLSLDKQILQDVLSKKV